MQAPQEIKNEEELYAEVIIPLSLPQTYTWVVPPAMHHALQPGSRVEVSFGKQKKYAGIVRSLHQAKPYGIEPKEILNVLDAEPVIFPVQIKLWQWMAGYYVCTEGDVMQAALPAHLKLSSETIISYNENHEFDIELLSPVERKIAEALDEDKELNLQQVQKLLDISNVYPVIKRLIEKKICYVWESIKEKYSEKTETYLQLNPLYHSEENLEKLINAWQRAPRQLDLLLAFLHFKKTEGEVLQHWLLQKTGSSIAQLKGLFDKNVLEAHKRVVGRLQTLPRLVNSDFKLSEHQQAAVTTLQAALQQKDVCLLHGVTGSGKTQVYMALIEEYLLRGKQTLFLLPEIALTAQIIRKLQAHFGGYVSVYHSGFNPNERVELWNKVKSGDIKIILGARSALLLPFHNLSLIVVDEEHDTSFKQYEPAPRYHARDTAIYYASLVGAKVVLGSATPSVESYYNATQNKYGLAELTERFGNSQMPEIELIDLKKVPKTDKNKIILSPQMKEAIAENVNRNKQVILFQNRRGYSPYISCNVCGWIPHCDNCDVSLTFHKSTNKLQCHYCGSLYPLVKTCIACGSQEFAQRNFGTERIEESIGEELVNIKTARMDVDSVRGKHGHEALISMFEQRRVDVLVGTQMVVKGLDFDHVGLVGILDADAILNYADFRVNERAFQLMEQVSGRAGRKLDRGKVLIQVSNTAHPLLPVIQAHNYRLFFDVEIEYRKQYAYPPFSRLIKIQCKHRYKNIAEQAARLLAEKLQPRYGEHIIGPAEPFISRIRNMFIHELMIKLPTQPALLQRCKQQLRQHIIDLRHEKNYSSVHVIVDVDPV